MNQQTDILSQLENKTKTTFAQQILLSKDGIVLDIGNAAFFNIPIYAKNPTFPLFFESIYSTLLDIELGDGEVFFPKIHSEKGYFDFRFCKMVYQNEIAIAWTLSISPNINQLFQQQQRANELLLKETK